MLVAIASDHAGFEIKEKLKRFLAESGYSVQDEGPSNAKKSDYPDYARKVAILIGNSRVDRGVLICGSGIGMCITANRYKRVRAAVLRTEEDALLSRSHNDANVACLGARITDDEAAKKIIKVFLSTPFEGGRHSTRVEKIDSRP